jgi:hypothetical protein
MSGANKVSKSVTIDAEVGEYIAGTRGSASTSERLNDLLRIAIQQEQRESLEQQAQSFYSVPRNSDRAGIRAFKRAAIRAQRRD